MNQIVCERDKSESSISELERLVRSPCKVVIPCIKEGDLIEIGFGGLRRAYFKIEGYNQIRDEIPNKKYISLQRFPLVSGEIVDFPKVFLRTRRNGTDNPNSPACPFLDTLRSREGSCTEHAIAAQISLQELGYRSYLIQGDVYFGRDDDLGANPHSYNVFQDPKDRRIYLADTALNFFTEVSEVREHSPKGKVDIVTKEKHPQILRYSVYDFENLYR